MDLGRSIAEYLVAFHAHSGPDATLVGAKAIVDLAGALRSGADQLTLLRLTPATSDVAVAPLAAWIATAAGLIIREVKTPEQPGAYKPPLMEMPIVAALKDNAPLFTSYPWFAVLWAFTHLLRWASTDASEYPRILAAFRRARFVKVRQFLDLKDLARQVHQYSRLVPLQLVALELMRELEERDHGGFVVRWRAVIDGKEKQRYGGVSIYCPWFEAERSDEFDALVEHEVYGQLDLPRLTGWAGFVLGPLYERLSGARARTELEARAAFELHVRWLRAFKRLLKDDCLESVPDGSDLADRGGPVKGSGPQAQIG